MKLSERDIQRLNHINNTMDGLYESLTLIYEALTDEKYEDVNVEVNNAINKLKEISNSLEEEL
tara:strand:- start:182 stop:370 length:189 start_codon:yes stop_codon:yes gene_type:complete